MKNAFAALLLAGAMLPGCAAGPATAQSPRAISATEKEQGRAAHPQLLQQYGGAFAGPQAALVTRVGQRVSVQSGLSGSGSDFTVTLLDSPVENAFAIPGGYVYVTRQLLGLMNSEAELASVMGHEVGHVAARHAASRNSRATLGALLAAGAGLVTGSEVASRAVGTGAQLYTLRYGRNQEYEADSLGIRYMTASGYTPFAAASILDSLDQSTTLAARAAGQTGRSVPTWASTHPNGQDRVERAYRIAQQTGRPAPARGTQDTAFLRALDGLPYGERAQKRVIRIVTVGQNDTVANLSERMAVPDLKRERFLTLNGLVEDEPLRPGMLVKIVAAG